MLLRSIAAFVLTFVCLLHPSLGAEAPKGQAGRPGIALKMELADKQANVTVALAYLRAAENVPRFQGVRFYIYAVPLDGKPHRVGWDKGRDLETVLLHGAKHTYTKGDVDRQENGSLSIGRAGKARDNTYRITGVYHYMDRLFVIDAVVKPGEPLLLYERRAEKK